ncbi:protein ENHANCED DISEASE RESISTANCE 2-like [Citrus sinensis]|uniref:protein ENHANCED DISEASE RESISTANCE 2-like n=1 Tax=Citrus sinensis TaxID=2711 RepID=UPI002277A19A|nr:protein ENHANCED DISEASE RESISTANCE 2-like [Citrus sinensis]
MSFNTIADAVSTCHLVSAIQFSMSRSGFGAMLSAVYGFKIKSRLFDGIDSILEDWIVDQMHIVFEGLTVEGILKNWSKIKPMIVKDWSENINARLNLIGKKGGGTIDLEPYLTHSSTMEPILASTHRQWSLSSLPWQWNGQQLLGLQHQLVWVLESARVAGLFRWLTQALLLVNSVAALEEEQADQIDLSCFSGNLRHDDRDNARDCWKLSDGNNFRVRSKHFCYDKTKIPAGKHLMDLVAVDWFKDTKRIDHVARRQGCAAQVASEKVLFSPLIFKQLVMGSLLQRFVDGDDEFRNSRLKLIPSVPKGSWIVRQSVGSTPCSLGKVVNCNYIRGPKYLEIDVDIGSSTVANGVLGLVIGVITTLVVDMASLVQANTTDELPERLIGAVHVSHIELKSAVVPKLEPEIS